MNGLKSFFKHVQNQNLFFPKDREDFDELNDSQKQSHSRDTPLTLTKSKNAIVLITIKSIN